MMINPDQYQFKTMLDVTLQGMLNDGFIERTFKKYQNYHPVHLHDALPYQPIIPTH